MAVLCVGVAGAVFAGSLFTDVSQHTAPGMVTQINAAFDAIEDSIDGTSKINGSFQDVAVAGNGTVSSNLTVTGTVTAANLATTTDTAAGDWTVVGHTVVGTNITATTGDIQSTAGTVYAGVGFDAVGDVDLDIGSADVDDVTVTTDGGTVVLDGSITASGACDASGYAAGATNGVSATITAGTNLTITVVGGIITAITSN